MDSKESGDSLAWIDSLDFMECSSHCTDWNAWIPWIACSEFEWIACIPWIGLLPLFGFFGFLRLMGLGWMHSLRLDGAACFDQNCIPFRGVIGLVELIGLICFIGLDCIGSIASIGLLHWAHRTGLGSLACMGLDTLDALAS